MFGEGLDTENQGRQGSPVLDPGPRFPYQSVFVIFRSEHDRRRNSPGSCRIIDGIFVPGSFQILYGHSCLPPFRYPERCASGNEKERQETHYGLYFCSIHGMSSCLRYTCRPSVEHGAISGLKKHHAIIANLSWVKQGAPFAKQIEKQSPRPKPQRTRKAAVKGELNTLARN